MNSQKTIRISSIVFIVFSLLSLLYVSLLSLYNPRATMALVQVTLDNNDAISSIRGIYGGVGMAVVFSLIYLLRTNVSLALSFLLLFWGMYALSRVMTMMIDGPLGDFGNQWLVIEGALFAIGSMIKIMEQKQVQSVSA